MTKKAATWLPPGFDLDKSYALQAILDGVADKNQQVMGMKYLVEDLCGTYTEVFDPVSDRMTAHLTGRRSIGLAVVQIAKLKLGEVKKMLEPPAKKERQ